MQEFYTINDSLTAYVGLVDAVEAAKDMIERGEIQEAIIYKRTTNKVMLIKKPSNK